jgi:putative NIF3 family GTP cyclohydrolase 1 type 2
MKLGTLYALAIKLGIENDPRPKAQIHQQLKLIKSAYRKLKKNQRWAFDLESLSNPYADTRILYGDKNLEIKNILVGVDIGVAELLLADRIRQRKSLDLVIAHHPQGKAYAAFYEVMQVQTDMLIKAGLAKQIAEKLVSERIKEVQRRVISANHNQTPDAAKILDLPFMCLHTPCDNFVARFVQRLMDSRKPSTLKQIVDTLNTIPEYRQATIDKAGPKIILGEPNNKPGKILVEMTGGTEGPKKVFARLSQAGVGTLVSMHLSEEHFNHVKDEQINVVIAGHISSDSLGMNLLLDRLEKREKFKIIGCSGFTRIRR